MKTRAILLLGSCLLATRVMWGEDPPASQDYSRVSSAPQSAPARLFFPRNFLRGFTEGGFFPPHNELDLGRCAASSGAYGGSTASCAAFSRYFLGGYVEFQLFARKVGVLPLERVFLFVEPRAFFGNNVPQVSYTASFSAIAFERSVGVVVAVRRNLDVRVWQHQNDWLGRYRHYLGPADLGSNGPYGMHAGISARWYFGGWGRRY